MRKFYTVTEAADILRAKPKTVWQLCKDHKIPATKPAGIWLIPADELDEWIRSAANDGLAS